MPEQKKSWIQTFTSLSVILIFSLFCLWFIKQESTDFFPTIFSIVVVIVTCITIKKSSKNLELMLFVDKSSFVKTFMPVSDETKNIKFIVVCSFFWLLIIDVIIILGLKYYYPLNPSLSNALETHFSFFLDTKKYITISNNWYNSTKVDYSTYFAIFPIIPYSTKNF